MNNEYTEIQATIECAVGNPWLSPEINWKNAICNIIKGVENAALVPSLKRADPNDKFLPCLTWSSLSNNLQINWNEQEKVITQVDDPIGAPKSLSRIGASVSCQVHHKNLAPVMSYGAYT